MSKVRDFPEAVNLSGPPAGGGSGRPRCPVCGAEMAIVLDPDAGPSYFCPDCPTRLPKPPDDGRKTAARAARSPLPPCRGCGGVLHLCFDPATGGCDLVCADCPLLWIELPAKTGGAP